MEKIFIKPAVRGSIVRHPEKLNYKISQDGEWVNYSVQWQRYLNSGDVVQCEPPAEVNEDAQSNSTKQKGVK